jgi:hypothetical protein
MTCLDAEVYVSALYDGEKIPSDAAQHIAECGLCHQILKDYSSMGAETRLAAAIQTAPLPLLRLPPRKSFWQFSKTAVRVPRFAVAGLLACLAIATITAVALHAQSRPLWFQFAYGLAQNPQFAYKVAQTGHEEGGGMMGMVNGSMGGAEVRVRIENVSSEDVALRIRAVPATFDVTSTGMTLVPSKVPISLKGVPVTHYKPGDDLCVPIDGGGILYLQGKVFDYQPKIAFGLPLEPKTGELIVRSPILTADERLVAEFSGASSSTEGARGQAAIFLNTKEGKFTFSLKQFPGAVEGEANWGQISFKIANVKYSLVAAAPITGGDQPTKLWVRRDETDGPVVSIGSGPI